jgi:hypothetical protein
MKRHIIPLALAVAGGGFGLVSACSGGRPSAARSTAAGGVNIPVGAFPSSSGVQGPIAAPPSTPAPASARPNAEGCPDPPDLSPKECAEASPGHRGTAFLYRERGWPRSMTCPCGQTRGHNVWDKACYQQAFATVGGEGLWIPPSPPPSLDSNGDPLYGCTWPWPSVGRRPADLVIVLVRSGFFEYGVNLYADGRFVIQSQRCPRDLRARTRRTSGAVVQQLMSALRGVEFRPFEGCHEAPHDSVSDLLAFYDQGQEHVAFTAGQSPQLSGLADLVDRTLGTAELLESNH